jgi:hypothetical protein
MGRFLTLLGLLAQIAFTLIVAALLALEIDGLQRQQAAATWPTTSATISSSKVVEHIGSKGGRTYEPIVEYTYSVNGTKLHGATIWINPILPDHSQTYAQSVAARFPMGAIVPVSVDPRNPSESMLLPGLSDRHRLDVLGVGILVVVMLAIWPIVFQSLATRWGKNRVGTILIIQRPEFIRCRKNGTPPTSAGLFAAAACLFITFLTGTFTSLASGGWTFETISLGVSAFAGLIVFVLVRRARDAGTKDIVLDHALGSISVPKGPFGRTPFVASYENVIDTELSAVKRQQGKYRVTMHDLLVRVGSDAAPPRLTLTFSRKPDAIAFEAWLREQLALTPKLSA